MFDIDIEEGADVDGLVGWPGTAYVTNQNLIVLVIRNTIVLPSKATTPGASHMPVCVCMENPYRDDRGCFGVSPFDAVVVFPESATDQSSMYTKTSNKLRRMDARCALSHVILPLFLYD